MKNKITYTFFLYYSIIIYAIFLRVSVQSQTTNLLTVTVSAGTNSGYYYLVNHGDLWHYRFGTNAPQSNWKTVPNSGLDSSWLLGPAGFGYEDGDDATILNNMSNRFTTLYIRRTFTVDNSVDPSAILQLVIDYDDAFVAWIDGVEVARSTNAPGAVGTEPPYNSISIQPNHEALGYRGLPPEVYNIGTVGSRLQPGEHILAIMGLNASLNSSDFSLIPDLRVVTTVNNVINGDLYVITFTNRILIQGSNNVPGSSKVIVNGLEASFNKTSKIWQINANLNAGENRIFIAATTDAGNIITGVTKHIFFIQNLKRTGGDLTSDSTFPGNGFATEITNNLIVYPSVVLTIEPGAVILMNPAASINIQEGAILRTAGAGELPVYFIPSDCKTTWGAIQANGLNASIYISNAVICSGQIIANNGATVEIINSTLRDFRSPNRLFLTSTNAQNFIIKRTRIMNYDQIRFSATPVNIEDSLFENIYSDGCDFADSSRIIIRRTTFRNGFGQNTDAVDLGNNPGTILDGLLIHNISDKAISVADSSHETIITNCLFYSNGIAISIYGSTNCVINQNTIANNSYGIWLRQRYPATGPGSANGTNNIIWGNTTNIFITDDSRLEIVYSDIQGDLPLPGMGNLNEDPIFNDSLKGDYKLKSNSPLRGRGYNGETMGMLGKIGGIPAEPLNLVAYKNNLNSIVLEWMDNSENETRFLVQTSTNAIDWTDIAIVFENTTSMIVSNFLKDVRYYFRIRAENDSGNSEFSNITTILIPSPTTYYGGILSSNTVWGIENGTIVVSSNLIIPSNVTLKITPGAFIKIAANTIIRATNGGNIYIEGSREKPVLIIPLDSSATHREISAYGTNSTLTIQFADLTGVQATVYQGAGGVIEDSVFHDYNPSNADTFTRPIVLTYYPGNLTIRRCHFTNYYELLLRNGQHLVEYCLFEDATGDALDFDAASPGTVVRQCTFRRGAVTNVDAIDIGNDGTRYSTFVTIDGCIMHDYPFDKGVSIGDGSSAITVKNCLIFNCNSGIAVKDECTATIYNCTLISNTFGINLQAKYPAQYAGGRATNTFNNIIWGNQTQIFVTNNPVIVVNYSNIQGTNWPGTGNISQNPLFKNPIKGDFRLAENSPCIGTGSNGLNMGVIYPIGGLPDIPSDFHVLEVSSTRITLSWAIPDNYYSGFVLEKSDNGSVYYQLTKLPANQTIYIDDAVLPGRTYYYRLFATNFIGSSFHTDAMVVTTQEEQIIIDVSKLNIQSGVLRIYINSWSTKPFILEASENLYQWTPIFTNSAHNGIVELLDAEVINHQKRFYRISTGR